MTLEHRRRIQLLAAAFIVSSAAACSKAEDPKVSTDSDIAVAVSAKTRSDSGQSIVPVGGVARTRAWTFMIYMNGDNNLEGFALQDFREMANIGSDDSVNIVVQMDRITGWAEDEKNDWTNTRRFLVTKDMEPTIAAADPSFSQEADMGSPAVLHEFVTWARAKYPARHYALVIWDHGDGWRVHSSNAKLTLTARNALIAVHDAKLFGRMSATGEMEVRPQRAPVAPAEVVLEHPTKAVSHDETSGTTLFNRAIQSTLESLLAGGRLDVLGFDACLMGMVETAYAFRNVANVLVASEELEPGDGWQYDLLLGPLARTPSMDGEVLGRTIVQAYETAYANRLKNTTLAAIDLRTIDALAAATTTFGNALQTQLPMSASAPLILAARRACRTYAPGYAFHNIDLKCFAAKLATSGNVALKNAADALEQARAATIISSYADARMSRPDYVSAGLAIYFPASGNVFNNDPLHTAYRDGLAPAQWPLQFVDDHKWDEFLSRYAVVFP